MAGKVGTVKRKRTNGLRARAWWILRKNKCTTLADLLSSIDDGSFKQAKSNIGRFLTELTRVGVLERERISDGKLTSNGVYLYTLKRDLGHKNPLLRKDGVFDPNSDTVLECNDE